MSLIHNTRFCYFFLIALAGILYANTLGHGFVLDDEAVILKNQFVRQGIKGIGDIFNHDTYAGYAAIGEEKSILEGGRYRPLSLAFFALFFSMAGDGAFAFHLFNYLLYILTGILIFKLLEIMLKDGVDKRWIALLTSTFFLVHPVHTEVVANIKSADELLALLFGLVFMFSLFKSADSRQSSYAILAGTSFFLACLSKESAVTLLLTGPLALWYFRKTSFGQIALLSLPVVVTAVIYFILRDLVLGGQLSGTIMHDPMNNPFLEWNGQAWMQCAPLVKAATLLFVFAKYVWMLLIPYPLTHDYYPFHITLQSFTDPVVWVGLMLLLGMIIYGIWSFRKKQIAGFGLLFFLISLLPVANIFFPVGTFMAERFLYLPSLGFLLALSVAAVRFVPAQKRGWLMVGSSLIVVLFSFMTINRNTAWKDNETLLLTDVKHAPNSAKLQNGAGTILLKKALQETDAAKQNGLLQEALTHLRKSIDLHPTYYDAWLAYGACAYYLQMFDESVAAYRKMAIQHQDDQNAMTGLRYALEASGRDRLAKGDTSTSILALDEAWRIFPDSITAMQLSTIYQSLHQPDSSAAWHERARKPGR